MRPLTRLSLRLSSLLRRKAADAELSAELDFHLQHQIAAHIASGLPAGDARRAALCEFGAMEELKEECRDASDIPALRVDPLVALRHQ